MTGRRVCLRCGATYHVEANPPRVKDVCDICGDKLVIRSDDQAEVVRHRLETYHEQTEPLKGYYEAQGKLKSIDGAQGITATEKFAVEALVCNMIHIKTEKELEKMRVAGRLTAIARKRRQTP